MANLKALGVSFGANFNQLDKDLSSLEKKLQATGQKLQSVGKTLSLSVTAPLTALGVKAVSLWDKQVKAIANVEAGLKSTGGAVGFTSKELQKMASSLQKTSLFGDEEILQSVTAQLLTFTNVAGEQFGKTQQAAVDLAAKMGPKGDLHTATLMLGKALNDPVSNLGALSRAGVQFSSDQEEVIKSLAESGRLAEAQNILLEVMEEQFGGAAEAARKAGTGPLQAFSMSLGDLMEQIGGIIAEALIPFVGHLQSAVDWFTDLDESTKKIIVVIGGLAASIGPVLMGIGSLLKLLPVMKAGFIAVQAAMGPVGLAAIALGTAAALLITNWDKVAPFMVELWGKIQSTFLNAIGYILEKVSSFIGIFNKDWGDSIKSLSDNFQGASKDIEAEWAAKAKDMRREMQETEDKGGDSAAELTRVFQGAARDTETAVSGAVDQANRKIDTMPSRMRDAAQEMLANLKTLGLDPIPPAFEDVNKAASDELRGMSDAAAEEADRLQKAYGTPDTSMLGAINNAFRDTFGENGVLGTLKSVFTGKGGAISLLQRVGEQGVGGLVGSITGSGGLVPSIGSIGDKIKGVLGSSGPWGMAIAGGLRVMEAFGLDTDRILSGIGKAFSGLFNKVTNIISGIGDKIKGLLGMGGSKKSGGNDQSASEVKDTLQQIALDLLSSGTSRSNLRQRVYDHVKHLVKNDDSFEEAYHDVIQDALNAAIESFNAGERGSSGGSQAAWTNMVTSLAKQLLGKDATLSASQLQQQLFDNLRSQIKNSNSFEAFWHANKESIVASVMDAFTSGSTGMARGGIAMPRPGGIFANLAERGQAELVTPLQKLPQLMASLMPGALNMASLPRGGGGRPIVIHNHMIVDGREVARSTATHLPEVLRLHGLG